MDNPLLVAFPHICSKHYTSIFCGWFFTAFTDFTLTFCCKSSAYVLPIPMLNVSLPVASNVSYIGGREASHQDFGRSCCSICDWILENSSKSHMKYTVILHVFNFISVILYVFQVYFLNKFRNFSFEFHTISRNILKYARLFMSQ